MIVLKFGGTSVSSPANLKQLKNIIESKSESFIVVVSAFSGITNLLESIATNSLQQEPHVLLKEFKDIHVDHIKNYFTDKQQTEVLVEIQKKCNQLENICTSVFTLQELSNRTRALILSFGERLSSFVVHRYLNAHGLTIELLDPTKIITGNGDYLNTTVDFEKTAAQAAAMVKNANYIIGGFIASNEKGEVVTLGRGGSDYTAALLGNVLEAASVEIWSDVNGVQSADPRKVKQTIAIENLSYEEAFEMAYFGAKVLYPPSVIPLRNKKIPLLLKNTGAPDQLGTYISDHNKSDLHKIQGVSSLANIAMITVSGVGLSGRKGSARQVFQVLEDNDINIILITQSCSEQSIGLGIDQSKAAFAKTILDNRFAEEIAKQQFNEAQVSLDHCIIALVGDKMKSKVGLCGHVFSAIGENGINVTAIAQGASERNISIVIDKKDETKALNVIHERFFSKPVKNIHIFIAGVGNVGGEFLTMLDGQRKALLEDYNLNLKICGVANSRKMLFDSNDGLSTADIKSLKENGKDYGAYENFLKEIVDQNLSNSVFLDMTASAIVSDGYLPLLKKSISVVTCNKIACSSSQELFEELNHSAREYNCDFKYETSVGAALPVIKTIQDLIISGDRIHKIEAVISGSLNFIFNEYDGTKPFADVVRLAMNEGYTEPDPLIDLSGLDVMRKILILSRESGLNREIDDITYKSFLPEPCENAASNEILFEELLKHESHFKAIYDSAFAKACKLKVVASLNDGNMSVALQEVPSHSPFYNLEGKDNVIALNTSRYVDEPLVIKGAGAGAEVTASGVFADLMLIFNRKS
ncbi:bifunctional aspartate kinase/homoserine dehydrogenase I [Nonlabens agnitus]|uniref:Bifunctional aspartate kinase/homoserine dehydrogenase I n=1 Tax=Nonlabens agnitus TaxID=870484 RepID=A0A2S9WR16_9FLAO|nr:bifunctional aspartate kinase/homoserine dehydrogenase I [Nonlabens agnitus]PRP65932.1 bifunctional aspartate kinase/homoserine dehydrogenase I [Nonlabens agnitus]